MGPRKPAKRPVKTGSPAKRINSRDLGVAIKKAGPAGMLGGFAAIASHVSDNLPYLFAYLPFQTVAYFAIGSGVVILAHTIHKQFYSDNRD